MLWIVSSLPDLAINSLQKSWLETLDLHQIGKYFTINIYCSRWKKNCRALSPEHINRKNTTTFAPQKHIKLKVISYIKKQKYPINYWKYLLLQQWSSLYWRLQKSNKKLQPEVSEHCLYLTVSTFTLCCFILQFFLIYHYEYTPIWQVQNTDLNVKTL